MNSKKIEHLKLRFRRDTDIGIHGILDSDAIRYRDETKLDKHSPDIRSPFFRDTDRIVHSKAYARYIDKSQVFFDLDIYNANVTHRSLHVILVSRLSRQIGRILKLNVDLIEAIALGHDIGHAPYGHVGEKIINDITPDYNLGEFNHNAQSIRWLSKLEKRFPKEHAFGLNLTLQVLDGILCHDGEINEQELKPEKINGKTWEDHFKEYNDCFGKNKLIRIPMSYEGVAVRFADTISYIGRDIEDAILLKYIKRKDIPQNCQKVLGDTNRTIIKTLMMDLLTYSLENDTIGYSKEVFNALRELKSFNYDKIYNRRNEAVLPKINKTFLEDLKNKFKFIFKESLQDLEKKNTNSFIFRDHIEYIDNKNYTTYYEPLKNQDNLPLIVRDYIAGMSEKYFKEIYLRLIKRRN
ncbi:MAG: HD domain-containing protein [Candidatus Lokiarchaeota archaeon]|nr:HD domain-containing protein [Candidatus Lokiarchaeota archaeon]MBD3198724.1 HD domain-containing protein [Candidatus Lokiarchaeota archaeon]